MEKSRSELLDEEWLKDLNPPEDGGNAMTRGEIERIVGLARMKDSRKAVLIERAASGEREALFVVKALAIRQAR